MTIEDIIQYLTQLDPDTLQDFIDYVDYRKAKKLDNQLSEKTVKARRRGKMAMDALILRGNAQKAYDAYLKLSEADKTNSMITAKALLNALKPKLRKREATGTIQTKYKSNWLFYMDGRPVIDDNGFHKRKSFGPYLYLRLWATGGGLDQDKRRLKSFYIGGNLDTAEEKRRGGYPYVQLAEHYESLFEQTSETAINKYDLAYIKYRKEQTAESEAFGKRIIDCIDLDQDPPVIDHDCLLALQEEIK